MPGVDAPATPPRTAVDRNVTATFAENDTDHKVQPLRVNVRAIRPQKAIDVTPDSGKCAIGEVLLKAVILYFFTYTERSNFIEVKTSTTI